MAEVTFSNIDETKVSNLMQEAQDNTKILSDIVDSVVNAHTTHLDALMKVLYNSVITDITDTEIERMCLELTNILYFMGDKLELVGMHNDISKALKDEVFNRSYINNQVPNPQGKQKTVNELNALATEDSKYENVVNSVYDRAYKRIKYKIEAGNKMVDILRKVLSKRMQDEQLSMYQPNNQIKIINSTEE